MPRNYGRQRRQINADFLFGLSCILGAGLGIAYTIMACNLIILVPSAASVLSELTIYWWVVSTAENVGSRS
jgi:hypothetical protein